jgi:ABC-2 type transport system permease protein
LIFIALIATVFSALGTGIGSVIEDMQGFQLVMNFLVMPIFFLSGALFPLDGQGKVLAAITMIDPLSYGIDGMRSVLLERTHFGAMRDFEVLVGIALVFIVFGAYRFSKIEI